MIGSNDLKNAINRIVAHANVPGEEPDEEEMEAVETIEPIGEPEPHDEDEEVEAVVSVEPIGEPEPKDNVNHPSHYADKQIEVIDYIRDTLDHEEFEGYCAGNVLKYVSRWRKKGGVEDLQKAQVYLGWMIDAAKEAKAKCRST